MKKISLLVMAVLATVIHSLACINGDTQFLSDGSLVSQHLESDAVHNLFFYKESYNKAYKQLNSLYKATKKIDYLSDKGVILILRGKYSEAIKFYLEIERMQPNRYSTASNLGTAYELNGQAEEALKWIKKAYEINPLSHEHSEWLHVKILEAKVKGDAYVTDNFLLHTSFGSGDEPFSKLHQSDLLRIKYALIYQLSERISFVKTTDKIVARLFFELANIEAVQRNFNNAVEYYKEAQAYGFTDGLLQARIRSASEGLQSAEKKISVKEMLYWSLGSLIVIVLSAFFAIKKDFHHRLFR
ncbi:tetratricopeptide repeat protein [Emticicia sp. C21]|uniref:tetratricopeptide repeat protein n=1 Tax=Emticicia sp. C21 TaxID=2302915 RepID=UPI000E356C7C|nr:tetratricopeptide repeat protein [Emticicia sp. C21]RFS16503.1 hypothetical protein D0T08_12540 [Emticicia sp. C21]